MHGLHYNVSERSTDQKIQIGRRGTDQPPSRPLSSPRPFSVPKIQEELWRCQMGFLEFQTSPIWDFAAKKKLDPRSLGVAINTYVTV